MREPKRVDSGLVVQREGGDQISGVPPLRVAKGAGCMRGEGSGVRGERVWQELVDALARIEKKEMRYSVSHFRRGFRLRMVAPSLLSSGMWMSARVNYYRLPPVACCCARSQFSRGGKL